MAIKATIFKCQIHISDMDREYYQTHSLTIARHPSETDRRMMVRILAFALNANEHLEFTRGLCQDDEPELWQKSLSDEIELWIELGTPDEKRLRKACSRAKNVILYCYGGRTVDMWWQQNESKLSRFDNLKIYNLDEVSTDEMCELVDRSMQLNCSIDANQVYLSNDQSTITIEPMLIRE